MRPTPYRQKQLDVLLAPCHTLGDLQADRMEIVDERPPNFAAIEKVFPNAGGMGVFFAYGNRIYNPSGFPIQIWILAHECTHALQQREVGTPELWWQRYLEDKQFRFDMELDAHRIEYRQFIGGKNRADRKRYLRHVAEKLSGPLYNNMVKRKIAQELIVNDIRDKSYDGHTTAREGGELTVTSGAT